MPDADARASRVSAESSARVHPPGDDGDGTGERTDRLDNPLKTHKFADHGVYGVLPKNIAQLLKLADPSPNHQCLRRGTGSGAGASS